MSQILDVAKLHKVQKYLNTYDTNNLLLFMQTNPEIKTRELLNVAAKRGLYWVVDQLLASEIFSVEAFETSHDYIKELLDVQYTNLVGAVNDFDYELIEKLLDAGIYTRIALDQAIVNGDEKAINLLKNESF